MLRSKEGEYLGILVTGQHLWMLEVYLLGLYVGVSLGFIRTATMTAVLPRFVALPLKCSFFIRRPLAGAKTKSYRAS